MEEARSFTEVLNFLQDGSNRDPRKVRLASATSVLVDLVEGEVNAGKIYSALLATLEGILHQEHQEARSVIDSLATQIALIELFSIILPYVSSAFMCRTLTHASRVLRSVISSCQSVNLDQTRKAMLETKDGLGAISSLLCASVRGIAALISKLPPSTDPKPMKQLVNALLSLLKDRRTEVRAESRKSVCLLLKSINSRPCHGLVFDGTSKYIQLQLDGFEGGTTGTDSQDFIDLLGFLQVCMSSLDFSTIGSVLMEILAGLLSGCLSAPSITPAFVSKSSNVTSSFLTINAILSTVLNLLEEDMTGVKKDKLDNFAARVLATLIQAKVSLVFREGTTDWDILKSARTICGQVILSATQRLLSLPENETGFKLLPLALQHVVSLSRPPEVANDIDVGTTLFVEISQLFRSGLAPMRDSQRESHQQCFNECLDAMKVIIQPVFEPTWSFSLKALAILLQQMNFEWKSVKSFVYFLIDRRCSMIENYETQAAFDDAFSALVQGIGIEHFWNEISLKEIFTSGDRQRSGEFSVRKWTPVSEFSSVSNLLIERCLRSILALPRFEEL